MTALSFLPLSSSGEWGFTDFIKRGLIEYLDVNEENVSLIALYEKHCNRYGLAGCVTTLLCDLTSVCSASTHTLQPNHPP